MTNNDYIMLVKELIDQSKTGVIATVGQDARPEAATVGISCDDDFKILIGTNRQTRKAQNILSNNRVALVVGTEGVKTVQIEGDASEISTDANSERIALHFARVPGAQKFAEEDGQTYFLVTPTWLRYTDYTRTPATYETKDFS